MFPSFSIDLVARPFDREFTRSPSGLEWPPPRQEQVVLDESVMRRSEALRDMMELARAIVADGQLSASEARGLQAWIESNPDVVGLKSVEEIVGILTNALDDGRLSDEERDQLMKVLERFGG
jgi:hypothetical protein